MSPSSVAWRRLLPDLLSNGTDRRHSGMGHLVLAVLAAPLLAGASGDAAGTGGDVDPGGLCGTWFDYRIRQVDGAWTVIGPEGPVAVS